MRTLGAKRPQSVRFDRAESPSNVNEGKGWREADARQFLLDHELIADDLSRDELFLRFKQFRPGQFLDTESIAPGVMLVLCERE